MTRAQAWTALLVLVTPLLLAATDPLDDVGRCPRVLGVAGGGAPDLVEATGEIVELGTSALFTLKFADPLIVPDDEGTPLRVDIVVLDPAVPPVDAGLYRGVNRLLRYDAVAQPMTTILLLPEAGQSRFIAPTIEDRTLVMQVPGRTLSADEDETGTSPGLERLRWGVIVRDERACDLLGDGRATHRLVRGTAPDEAGSVAEPRGWSPNAWPLVAVTVVVTGASAAYLLRGRPRNPR